MLTRKAPRPTPRVAPRRDVVEPRRRAVNERVEEPERALSLREAEVVQEADHRRESLRDGGAGVSISVKVQGRRGTHRRAGGRPGDRLSDTADDDLVALALRCDVRVSTAGFAVRVGSAL